MTTSFNQEEAKSESILLKFFPAIDFSAKEKEIRKILQHSEVRGYALSSLKEIKLLHRKISEKLEIYHSGNLQYKNSILKDLDIILNNFLEKSKFPTVTDTSELEALGALFFPIKNQCHRLRNQLEDKNQTYLQRDLAEMRHNNIALSQCLEEEQGILNKELFFKDFLRRIKKEISDRNPQPKGIYFAYAWPTNENEEKEDWVQNFLVLLKEHLELAGLTTIRLDIISSRYGGNIYEYMQKAKEDDYVLLFGTESLKEKHDGGISAVCTEIIQILRKREAEKEKGKIRVFPILLSGSDRTSFPVEYERYLIIKDWRKKGYLLGFQELYLELFDLLPERYLSKTREIWDEQLTQYTEKEVSVIGKIVNEHQERRKEILGTQSTHSRTPKTSERKLVLKRKVRASSKKLLLLLIFGVAALALTIMLTSSQQGDFKSIFLKYIGIKAEEKKVFIKAIHPDFIGRKEYLDNLKKVLLKGQKHTLPVAALCGDGGIGKSELAIAFASKNLQHFSLVYWIESDIQESYNQGYRDLAKELQIPFKEKDTPKEIRKKVHTYLEQKRFSKPWLLIFDNAETVLDLPQRGNGSILITSRNQGLWHSFHCIPLSLFSEKEAAELFKKVTKKDETPARKVLIQELGYFPLVLNQAAHYIAKAPWVTEAEFLERLIDNKDSLLKQMPLEARYPYSLAVSWQITAAHLHSVCEKAIEWLQFCSYLYPDSIPQEWLEKWLQKYNKELKKDPFQRKLKADSLLATLIDYSLVRYDEQTRSISLHRLRQEVMQNSKGFQSRKEEALAFLAECVDGLERREKMGDRTEKWDKLHKWEPHAVWFLNHFIDQINDPAVATLQNALGNWRFIRGDYKNAEAFQKQALETRRKLFGEDHPLVVISMQNLGQSLGEQGKCEEARESFEYALNINEKLFGVDSIEVGASLFYLGWVLERQGKQKEAQKLMERALKMNKKLFGEESSEVSKCIHVLGRTLTMQGKYEEAQAMIEQALKLNKKLFGKEHPTVASGMLSLGVILGKQGQYEEAKRLMEQALKMSKKFLGEEHPDIAYCMHCLGRILERLDKDQEAQKAIERAFEIWKQLIRDESIQVAISLVDIGYMFGKKGKYKEAQQLLEQALALRKKLLGKEHPQIADSLKAIGWVLGKQGEYEEGKKLIKQSLEMSKHFFSDGHPQIAEITHELAIILASQGKHLEAKKLLNEALEMRQRFVSNQHPEVADLLRDLGMVHFSLGEAFQAKELLERALKIYMATFGKKHSHTAKTKKLLHQVELSLK